MKAKTSKQAPIPKKKGRLHRARKRIRHLAKRARLHAGVIAKHPHTKEAARSLAWLGGIHLLTQSKMAQDAHHALKVKAARHWRGKTHWNSPQRERMMEYMMGPGGLGERHAQRNALHGSILWRRESNVRRRAASRRRTAKKMAILADNALGLSG